MERPAAAQTVVPASWALTPPGLAAGDKFRLIFATSTKRSASSGDIAAYNTFVQDRAAAGHAAIRSYASGFRAVGCTEDVDARDNTGTTYTSSDKGVPIYWLGGNKVADDYEDFYDGDWDEEASTKNEAGSYRDVHWGESYPLTGCKRDGTEAFESGTSAALGNTGGDDSRIGVPDVPGHEIGPIEGSWTSEQWYQRPLYGLSEVLQVGDANSACATEHPDAEWCTTLTVAESPGAGGTHFGFARGSYGTLDDPTLRYGTTQHDVVQLAVWDAGTGTGEFVIGFDGPERAPHGTVFELGEETFTASANAQGTNNAYRWSLPAHFAWAAGEKVTVSANLPPVLVSARVDGEELTLMWHEDLDTSSVPAASDFEVRKTPQGGTEQTVTVSGTPSISGNTLTLTLASAVTARDGGVTVSYTPGTDPVQDESGISAPGFTAHSATNETSGANATGAPAIAGVPQVGPGGVRAQLGTMADKDGLPADFPYDYEFQWMRVDGTTETVIGDATEWYYHPSVADIGHTLKVEVTFTDGAHTAERLVSEPSATVVAEPQTCRERPDINDWCSVLVVAASGAGTRLGFAQGSHGQLHEPTIQYGTRPYEAEVTGLWIDEAGPGTGEIVVESETGRIPRGTVFNFGGREFTADAASEHATGTGSGYRWERPADLVWLDGQTMLASARLALALRAATAVGSRVTLTYHEDIDTGPVPAPEAYSVSVGGGAGATPSQVHVRDNQVRLTLATALTPADTDVTVSYTPGAGPLQDRWGRAAASLTNEPVRNESAPLPPPPPPLAPGLVYTNWALAPSGLAAGDRFRLIFATSGQRQGGSSDIDVYNTFVQKRAAGGHDEIRPYASGFRAVGCTEDVDARDNTATTYTSSDKGVPIYWLGGNKVADDYEDFYDGDWDDEAKPKNESGERRNLNGRSSPFTGCEHDGTESIYSLGSLALGSDLVRVGKPNGTESFEGPLSSKSIGGRTSHSPLYGLSEVLELHALPSHLYSIEVTSGPGPWDSGDTIEFAARFNVPVTVTGTPVLRLAADWATHDAALIGGSGTQTLVFAWTVPDTLGPDAGDVIVTEGIVLDQGATIVDDAGEPVETGYPEARFEGLVMPGVGPPLTASFESAPPAHDEHTPFTVELVFSEVPTAFRNFEIKEALRVYGGQIRQVRIVNGDKAHRRITIEPYGPGAVALGIEATTDCAAAHAMCTPAGARLEEAATIIVYPWPTLSVSDAGTREGPDAALEFTLRINHEASFKITASISAQDGTATAGDDYTAPVDKVVVFPPGQTVRRVSIPVSEDNIEEDDETITLHASAEAAGGVQWSDSAQGTGTIEDAGPATGVAPLVATFENVPDEHLEDAFTVDIIFSEPPVGPKRPEVRSALRVDGGRATRVRRVGGDAKHRRVTIEPWGWGDVRVTLPTMTNCTVPGTLCTAAGGLHESTVGTTIPGPATLSVADARVEEAPDATLAFAVTLTRERSKETRVDYATEDGTADAGADYTATSGTLTFAPGETARTILVPVLDDAHDEDEETVLLKLSNPNGARIGRGTATGTIENTDHMPKAWLVRFAREAAETAFNAADERLRARPGTGWNATVAGVPLGTRPTGQDARDDLDALARWLDESPLEAQSRRVTGRDLLTGTSFSLNASDGEAGGSAGSVWARGTLSSFSGTEDELDLDGELSTMMLGADIARDRWAAGAMVSHSRGDGTYTERAHGGSVESTVTGLYPYGRIALNERVTLWGITGYGEGTLGLTPDGQKTIETDIDLAMAGLGLRGTVLRAPAEGGAEITLTTDALGVRATSDRVDGALAAAQGTATRLRLGAETVWHGLKLGASALTPQAKFALRHDAGDAETGFGVDIGGGLRWTGRTFNAEVSARGLLSHESEGFTDRRLAGTIAYDPRPGSDRGLAVTLRQSIGASTSGGADALLRQRTIDELGAGDADDLSQRRLELRIGYGLPAFGSGFTATPEVGLGLSNETRDYRLGWQLGLARSGPASVELKLEARRSESGGADAPEHALGLSLGAQW